MTSWISCSNIHIWIVKEIVSYSRFMWKYSSEFYRWTCNRKGLVKENDKIWKTKKKKHKNKCKRTNVATVRDKHVVEDRIYEENFMEGYIRDEYVRLLDEMRDFRAFACTRRVVMEIHFSHALYLHTYIQTRFAYLL